MVVGVLRPLLRCLRSRLRTLTFTSVSPISPSPSSPSPSPCLRFSVSLHLLELLETFARSCVPAAVLRFRCSIAVRFIHSPGMCSVFGHGGILAALLPIRSVSAQYRQCSPGYPLSWLELLLLPAVVVTWLGIGRAVTLLHATCQYTMPIGLGAYLPSLSIMRPPYDRLASQRVPSRAYKGSCSQISTQFGYGMTHLAPLSRVARPPLGRPVSPCASVRSRAWPPPSAGSCTLPVLSS